jgi:hypothetical protein
VLADNIIFGDQHLLGQTFAGRLAGSRVCIADVRCTVRFDAFEHIDPQQRDH